MDVLGVDPSLTATGIAMPTGEVFTITTRLRGMARLDHIAGVVVKAATGADVVAIEGYAFGHARQAAHLGELGGTIRLDLWRTGVTYVDVPPLTVKKYATGKGNAGKDEVLAAAIRRLGYTGHSNDEADALWLRAVTADAYGAPVVTVPAAHRAALDKVGWP